METNFPGGLWLPILAVLIVSLPFVFHYLKSRRQEKDHSESFQDFVTTRQLVLDKVERWRNHYLLGLDLRQNVLVYCRFGHYSAQTTIRLEEIDHASLDAHYEEVPSGKSKQRKLVYLDILLHYKDPNKAAKSLTIYDQQQIRKVADELFIAENWVTTLNKYLKSVEEQNDLRLAI